MNRHAIHRRRTRADQARRAALHGQTAAASALAGGCLAVVALWTTASRNAAASGGR